MTYEDQPMDQESDDGINPAESRAAERVKLPAIFLIVVGALNVLGALFCIFQGVKGMGQQEEIHKGFEQGIQQELGKKTELSKQDKEQAEQMAKSMEKFVTGTPVAMLIAGIIGLLAAGVTIFAGVRMMSLRSRGLAMLGSVLAALPCISIMGCCGVGEGIGIWSLIVLMSQDVKAAFR
jgi:hypothetical protein